MTCRTRPADEAITTEHATGPSVVREVGVTDEVGVTGEVD